MAPGGPTAAPRSSGIAVTLASGASRSRRGRRSGGSSRCGSTTVASWELPSWRTSATSSRSADTRRTPAGDREHRLGRRVARDDLVVDVDHDNAGGQDVQHRGDDQVFEATASFAGGHPVLGVIGRHGQRVRRRGQRGASQGSAGASQGSAGSSQGSAGSSQGSATPRPPALPRSKRKDRGSPEPPPACRITCSPPGIHRAEALRSQNWSGSVGLVPGNLRHFTRTAGAETADPAPADRRLQNEGR